MAHYQFTVTLPFSTQTSLPDGSGVIEATATPGVYRFVRNGVSVEFTPDSPIPTGTGVVVQSSSN